MKYRSRIIPGQGRGTEMNTPTLNFEIPPQFPYPHGIYAGYVHTDGRSYHAAFHYGPIPTFGNPKPSLEALVLAGMIPVNTSASFELIRYLRPIKKFPNAGALREQIDADIAATKGALLPGS